MYYEACLNITYQRLEYVAQDPMVTDTANIIGGQSRQLTSTSASKYFLLRLVMWIMWSLILLMRSVVSLCMTAGDASESNVVWNSTICTHSSGAGSEPQSQIDSLPSTELFDDEHSKGLAEMVREES